MASYKDDLAVLSKDALVALASDLLASCSDGAAILSKHIDKKDIMADAKSAITAAREKRRFDDKNKPKKAFDMSRYRQRNIAMQVQYEGGPYFGFAYQTGDCENTVEKHLFDAFIKLKLIESHKECAYTRCGRTDKGVSALGQVISLRLRSSMPLDAPDDQLPAHPCDDLKPSSCNDGKPAREMDYCAMLNRCLPEEIRVIGWTEVTDEFSSRFSSAGRTYRYFFTRGTLDIEAMRKAASYLLGEHDFRNLCKLDVANVTNFRREIFSAEIKPFVSDDHTKGHEDNAEAVWMLEISGIAFLWHMIRCIMAVLFFVGEGKEPPEVVPFLLDIEKCPAKPHYSMAHELPLVLHGCQFDNLTVHKTPRNLWQLTSHYAGLWERHTIAAARAKNNLEYIKTCSVRRKDVNSFIDFLSGKERGDGHAVRAGGKDKQPKGCVDETARSEMPRRLNKRERRLAARAAKLDAERIQRGQNAASSSSSMGTKVTEPPGCEEEGMDTSEGSADRKRKRDGIDDGSDGDGDDGDDGNEDDCLTEECDDSEVEVLWGDILAMMRAKHKLVPTNAPTKHMPLVDRKTNESYENRIHTLGGARKERYDRHIELQKEAKEASEATYGNGHDDGGDTAHAAGSSVSGSADFFKKMRQQGNKVSK